VGPLSLDITYLLHIIKSARVLHWENSNSPPLSGYMSVLVPPNEGLCQPNYWLKMVRH